MSARPTSCGVPGRAGFRVARRAALWVLCLAVVAGGCARTASSGARAGGKPAGASQIATGEYVCALCGRDLSHDSHRVASTVSGKTLLYFCSADHLKQYVDGHRAPVDKPYCVVCLRTVSRDDPLVRSIEQDGRQYLVCSPVCEAQFKQKPELFIKADVQ